jgi:type I restriction enzyme S subunit
MVLNDVCEIITCGVAKRPEYTSQGIPFLSSKNVKEDRFILDHYNYVSEKDYETLTKHNKPEKGDVLYTRVGSFGEAAVIDLNFDFAIFVSLTLLKPKRDILFSRFLMYYLNSPKIKGLAERSTSGIGVQNLNVNTVRKFPINLPPLETQKQIAQILDNAAALRDKTKQLLTEYDALAQSIFLDMFGDPVVNPKEWVTNNIENVCFRILGGGTPKKSNEEYFTGDIPWVTPKDMKKLYVNNSKIKITKNAVDESSAKLIPKNSILMVIRSGILKKKLPVAICTSVVTVNQDMKAFIANEKIVNPKYLLFFFLNAQKYLLGKVRAVTADNIEFSQIKQMKIPVPDIELQNHFTEKVALIEQQKELAKQELKESEDLFNCLLQKAFKGELV